MPATRCPFQRSLLYAWEPLEPRLPMTAYFIDPLHGSDDRDGQSEAGAFRTVANLVSQYVALQSPGHIDLRPGDEIVLLPGTHEYHYRYGEGQWESLFLRNVHGTEERPITIRGVPGARVASYAPDHSEMSSIHLLQSSHIVIEGLDVTAYGSAIRVAESSDVAIRDNHIHDVDGVAANNLSGVYLTDAARTRIERNFFRDNYDRAHPGNVNNRHVVVFGSADVQIVGNRMFNSDPDAGMAVDYKHLGSLRPGGTGSYEVAYNVIENAAGIGIGTAAPNSHIHHNLLINSGAIRVADLGGGHQLANETIEFNTIVNSGTRLGTGGLEYVPTETPGFPIGVVRWRHNVVIDGRDYTHSEQATIVVSRFGGDDMYREAILGGLLEANGNTYQTKDEPRFDLFGANGGSNGTQGEVISFSSWQVAGFDRDGREADSPPAPKDLKRFPGEVNAWPQAPASSTFLRQVDEVFESLGNYGPQPEGGRRRGCAAPLCTQSPSPDTDTSWWWQLMASIDRWASNQARSITS